MSHPPSVPHVSDNYCYHESLAGFVRSRLLAEASGGVKGRPCMLKAHFFSFGSVGGGGREELYNNNNSCTNRRSKLIRNCEIRPNCPGCVPRTLLTANCWILKISFPFRKLRNFLFLFVTSHSAKLFFVCPKTSLLGTAFNSLKLLMNPFLCKISFTQIALFRR